MNLALNVFTILTVSAGFIFFLPARSGCSAFPTRSHACMH